MMRGQMLDTRRMKLRACGPEDLPLLQRIYRDPNVMRFTGGVVPIEKVKRKLHYEICSFEHYGFAHGIILQKGSEEMVGRGGVACHDRNDPSNLELSYAFRTEYWHRGLATEFATAAIRFGFSKTRAKVIYATAAPENVASVRVLEKAGMSFKRYWPETDRLTYTIRRESACR